MKGDRKVDTYGLCGNSNWKTKDEEKGENTMSGTDNKELVMPMSDTCLLKQLTEKLRMENREVQDTMKDTVMQFEKYGNEIWTQIERMEHMTYSLDFLQDMSDQLFSLTSEGNRMVSASSCEMDLMDMPARAIPFARAIHAELQQLSVTFDEVLWNMESIDCELLEKIVENLEEVCDSESLQEQLYSRIYTILEDLPRTDMMHDGLNRPEDSFQSPETLTGE